MEASEVRGALEDGWPELASMLADHDADSLASGLSYLEMTAVVRFLAEKLRTGDIARFPAFFQAVERCLHDGDERAVQLVVVGLLEGLQNGNITALDDYSVWFPFLGPNSRRAWQAVEAFWKGDADALRRYSAQPDVPKP